jgi:hypothetical protein
MESAQKLACLKSRSRATILRHLNWECVAARRQSHPPRKSTPAVSTRTRKMERKQWQDPLLSHCRALGIQCTLHRITLHTTPSLSQTFHRVCRPEACTYQWEAHLLRKSPSRARTRHRVHRRIQTFTMVAPIHSRLITCSLRRPMESWDTRRTTLGTILHRRGTCPCMERHSNRRPRARRH